MVDQQVEQLPRRVGELAVEPARIVEVFFGPRPCFAKPAEAGRSEPWRTEEAERPETASRPMAAGAEVRTAPHTAGRSRLRLCRSQEGGKPGVELCYALLGNFDGDLPVRH